MPTLASLSQDYERVEKAIAYVQDHFKRQPHLSEIAGAVGLSEHHFQRLFSRWVGISPKRFLQYTTKEYARRLLDGSEGVLDVSFAAGLSGTGRLHDLMVAGEAMTPGEIKQRGAGLTISFGFHPSPFGQCLLAVTGRGLCGLRFVGRYSKPQLVRSLRSWWPQARITEDQSVTRPVAEQVFRFPPAHDPAPLHLYVSGTNFQIKVWEALLKIPLGRAVTYSDIARHIGLPEASRAVGNAVGKNPIPYLIPCHRVIRKMGEFGNYGEGPDRKKALLAWEAVQARRLNHAAFSRGNPTG